MVREGAPCSLLSSCMLPTEFGRVELRVYEDASSNRWVAWAAGHVFGAAGVLVRVHDACLTSEVRRPLRRRRRRRPCTIAASVAAATLAAAAPPRRRAPPPPPARPCPRADRTLPSAQVLASTKCDCAEQLRLSQKMIGSRSGVLIYTPQEGRGIGLAKKIAAYRLQEEHGLDTVDANRALGLPDEVRLSHPLVHLPPRSPRLHPNRSARTLRTQARSYDCVPMILEDLGVRSIKLLTNNPFKARDHRHNRHHRRRRRRHRRRHRRRRRRRRH